MPNDVRVVVRKLDCPSSSYLVEVDAGSDGTYTWGFSDINDVKLWHKILEEIIDKWTGMEKQKDV